MIQKLLGTLLCFAFSVFIISPAYAHVLKSDGSVGAVLHVSPEDDPIAGSPSNFFFEFKDTENKFEPQNCNCIVKVLKSGKEVFSTDLFHNNLSPSLSNASFTYAFPERDIYTIKVYGAPKKEGQFNPFALSYDMRVARGGDSQASQNENSSSLIYFVIGTVLFLFVIIFIVKKFQKGGDSK